MKLCAVTVQLQVSALAELRNDTQHWRDGGEREGTSEDTSINWSEGVWKNGNLVLLGENASPEIKAAEKKMKAEFMKSDLEDQHRFAIVNNRTRSLKIAY